MQSKSLLNLLMETLLNELRHFEYFLRRWFYRDDIWDLANKANIS